MLWVWHRDMKWPRCRTKGGFRVFTNKSSNRYKLKSCMKERTWVKSLYRVHSREKEGLNSAPFCRRDSSRVYSFTTKLKPWKRTSTMTMPSAQERCMHLYSFWVDWCLWPVALRLDDVRSLISWKPRLPRYLRYSLSSSTWMASYQIEVGEAEVIVVWSPWGWCISIREEQ